MSDWSRQMNEYRRERDAVRSQLALAMAWGREVSRSDRADVTALRCRLASVRESLRREQASRKEQAADAVKLRDEVGRLRDVVRSAHLRHVDGLAEVAAWVERYAEQNEQPDFNAPCPACDDAEGADCYECGLIPDVEPGAPGPSQPLPEGMVAG